MEMKTINSKPSIGGVAHLLGQEVSVSRLRIEMTTLIIWFVGVRRLNPKPGLYLESWCLLDRLNKVSAMHDASCVTDRQVVLTRQEDVNLLPELAHHCCDANRPILAAQHNTWNRLRRNRVFPNGFFVVVG